MAGDNDKTVLPGRPPDDDATVIAPKPAEADEHSTLPVGTRLGEFEIRSVIGTGGFGIVYLAHDHSLGRDVALKEYLPASLAFRNGMHVSVRTARDKDTFSAGLSSFINEARVLAHFDNPSLVKVYRFWSENGTAYMVMPYYDGPTLKQTLQQASAPPTEEWLRALLAPLLSALQLLHSENYFHRDIAPDNILLVKGERPILLDFGAARRVIAGSDKALTVILKPGFAPVEQYSESDMAQGAWTDIYALAAVMHYAITGKAPVQALSRIIRDTAVPLAQAAAGRYSDGFLRAIDKALSVRPEDRPRSTAEFGALLGLEEGSRQEAPRRRPEEVSAKGTGWIRQRRKAVAVGGVVAAGVIASLVMLTLPQQKLPAASPVASAPPPQAADLPAATDPAPAPPAATAATAVRTDAPPAPAPAPAAELGPFDPADALAQVYALRDADFNVGVTLERTTVRVGKDKLRFKVRSDKGGYLYILMLGTDRRHLHLLFPNELDARNQARADQPLSLPRAGWAMVAGGPPGTNEFVALVSERPRDFSRIGLTKAGPFAEFSIDQVAALFRSSPPDTAVLAGTPVCAGGGPCSPAYGAARFTIHEVE